MSALGHEPTCAPQNVMSALPPIATLIAYFHEGFLAQRHGIANLRSRQAKVEGRQN